jgi:hypothetical protein
MKYIKLFEAFIKPYPEHPTELDPYSFNDTLSNFFKERIVPTIKQDAVTKLASYLGKTHKHGSVGFDKNYHTNWGKNLIDVCIEYNAIKCLKYLISIGVELKNNNFKLAANLGEIDILKYLFSVIDAGSMFTKIDVDSIIKSGEEYWNEYKEISKEKQEEILNYLKSKL